jgi:hypothetical protein
MEKIDQTPQVDPRHFTDSAHGDAMEIMHHRHLSRDLVTIESFGKNAGCLRPENMVTTRTLSMGEMIENLLGLHWLTFNHGAMVCFFEFQYPPTIRTDLSYVDRDDLIGRLLRVSFSPMTLVTWTGTPLVIPVFFVGIGF